MNEIIWSNHDGIQCRGTAIKLIETGLPRYVVKPISGVDETTAVMFVPKSKAKVVDTSTRDRGILIFLQGGVKRLGIVGHTVTHQGETVFVRNCVCDCLVYTANKECEHTLAIEMFEAQNDNKQNP